MKWVSPPDQNLCIKALGDCNVVVAVCRDSLKG